MAVTPVHVVLIICKANTTYTTKQKSNVLDLEVGFLKVEMLTIELFTQIYGPHYTAGSR